MWELVLGGAIIAMLFCPDAMGANLYRCTLPSGASVLTDSPVQLQHCEVVEPGTGATQEPTTSRPPATPPQFDEQFFEPFEQPPADRIATGQPEQQVTVPVQRLGHLLIVSTQLNGNRDARLILDTGASHTILSREVSDDLGLMANGEARRVTLKTAGGSVEAHVVQLDSIRVSDAEVRNSLVAVYDMPDAPPGIDGLLGLTFLSQFTVTLDTAKGKLHLRPTGK